MTLPLGNGCKTYPAGMLGQRFYLTKLKMADQNLHSTDSRVPLSQVKINININICIVFTRAFFSISYLATLITPQNCTKMLKIFTFVVQFASCFSIRPIKGKINKNFFVFHSFEQLLGNRFGKLGATL